MPIDPNSLEAENLKLAQQAVRVTAPSYYAASFQIQVAGNDAQIILQRPQPATLPPYGEPAPFALIEVVAVIHVSTATLKDLSVVLSEHILKMEEHLGHPVETEYTKRISQPKS